MQSDENDIESQDFQDVHDLSGNGTQQPYETFNTAVEDEASSEGGDNTYIPIHEIQFLVKIQVQMK